MRIGEAIALEDQDLDLERAVLIVRNSKFGRSRLVPLHPTTAAALARYLKLRDHLCPQRPGPALFVSSRGTRLLHSNIQLTFAGLTKRCGITRRSASCRPRIHDFRHAFAVTSLLSWYVAGEDVAAMLPRPRPTSGTPIPSTRSGTCRPRPS